jgi:hypothetical protein
MVRGTRHQPCSYSTLGTRDMDPDMSLT